MLLYYTTEVCNAVDALHQMGIIHADIKPDNFMLRDIRFECMFVFVLIHMDLLFSASFCTLPYIYLECAFVL